MEARVRQSEFKTIVADTISRHHLLSNGDRVIVALSGGADSVALLAVLDELGYDCLAAHCNYHLRGEESQRDMRHAEAVCERLGVDIVVRDFDVEARRRETGESVEMACRELRYSWFDELLIKNRARAVAVGHHLEDNIETLLLNLFRGTGIDGLRGIRYRRDAVIRPMLDTDRPSIEAYLAERGLDYVVDSSNSSDAYLRNRLRNHVIPEIERQFPGAVAAMRLTMNNVASACDVYTGAIDSYLQTCLTPDGDINLTMLREEAGNSAATVLYAMLRKYGITASACDDILASADGSGLEFHGRDGLVAELDRGIIHINLPTGYHAPDSYDVNLNRDILTPINIRIFEHDISEFKPRRDPAVIYLDASALGDDHRWTLRRWRKGDRIRPFGMAGSKMVSDLFVDAHYSARDKRCTWILDCDGEIVWVVGLRASRLFEVTPATRRYLKLEYITLT